MDDFGIQYTGRLHSEHLLNALQENYEVTTDWEGKNFGGINFQWDYNKHTCHLTMNGYITKVRIRFGHTDPTKPQHSPQKHCPITYASKAQLETDEVNTSPRLDTPGIKRVQGIVGCLLYYARAVDNNYTPRNEYD